MLKHFSSNKSLFTVAATCLLLIGLVSCSSDSSTATIFEVRIENISAGATSTASNGGPVFSILAPGVFIVHRQSSPVYTVGAALPENGFEAYAEDGNITPILDSLRFADDISLVGIVDELVDGTRGLIGPGESFRFVISATDAAEKLSLFLQYLESNDIVLGTGSEGIALFDAAGNPISGDFTASFALYDVGTEINEEPGVGPNQPIRQPEANTGPAEGGIVRLVDDGFSYPPIGTVFRITITPIASVDAS